MNSYYKDNAANRFYEVTKLKTLLGAAVDSCFEFQEGELTVSDDEKDCLANFIEKGYYTLYTSPNETFVMENLPAYE